MNSDELYAKMKVVASIIESDVSLSEYRTALEAIPLPSFYTLGEDEPVITLAILPDAEGVHPYAIQLHYDGDEELTNPHPHDIIALLQHLETTQSFPSVFIEGETYLIPGNEGQRERSTTVRVLQKDGTETVLAFEAFKTHHLARNKFYIFLKSAYAYEQDPTDFYKAFRFLDQHPAFWYRYTEDSPHWITSELNLRMWMALTHDHNRRLVYMFETGSAIEPARTIRYHDTDLDTNAYSYEEGIIALAGKVHAQFTLHGEERTI